MSDKLVLDRAGTALVMMDFQNEILSGMAVPAREQLLANAAAVLKRARQLQLPVVHITVQFEDGYPEVNMRNKSFSGMKAAGRLKKGSAGAQIAAAVAPIEGEAVLAKCRVGAFSTTPLATLLGARNATHLVLAGYATSGCVLSTVRWAADMDYQLTVVADACADGDEDVHRVLMQKVFPRQAAVVNATAFAQVQAM